MEKQDQNIRSWDDLIFENRNKSYGAYALRQEYSNRLLKGLIVSVGFATVLFATAGLLKESKIIEDLPRTLPEIVIGSAPTIVVPQTPRLAEPVRQTNRNVPPVAVTTPDTVEPTEEPATTSTGTEGTPDGTAVTDTGTSAGTVIGTDLGTTPVRNNEPFIHVEVMPEYKGGLKGMIRTLERNMRYPASARRMGKEGTVFVEFVVSDEGDVIDIKVVRGFDRDCDKEAVRMVEKLTEWTPGLQNKLAVNVKMVLPIKFKLEQ
jgi:protein TonB